MRRSKPDDMQCSFCHKKQDVVAKLISSPSDYDRVYICDECVAVCQSILEDDGVASAAPTPLVQPRPSHCLMCHPMAPALLMHVERWARAAPPQSDFPPLLQEVRRMARSMMGLDFA